MGVRAARWIPPVIAATELVGHRRENPLGVPPPVTPGGPVLVGGAYVWVWVVLLFPLKSWLVDLHFD